MAHTAVACFFLILMLKISASNCNEILDIDVHDLPYWIQNSLLEYADEIGDRNLTGPIRKIYRKDLSPNYVAYYEFQFTDLFFVFSSGPKTDDHRLVQEGQVPRITDILIAQADTMNKVCQKFFRLNADGISICEDDAGKAVAATVDLRTLTTHVNTSTLSNDVKESLTDFADEWKKHAKEIRSSLEWKEMVIYVPNKTPSTHQSIAVYKVLTRGDSQAIPIGTTDISKVEIRTHLQKSSSNSKKRLSTLCLLLGNICSKEGKVNVSKVLRKRKNLANLNYIEMDVTHDYESLMIQINSKNIDFYLKLTVAGKFVVIRRYTITLSRKRNKRSSCSDSTEHPGFTEHSIPYETLMPDYDQHKCCGGCDSGCTPVGWAQIFAYYDRVAHQYGYRYSTSHWRGVNGVSGSPSYIAPASMNTEVQKYVEKLGTILKTDCGSTTMSNTDNVHEWFKNRQGSGRVERLSMSGIRDRIRSYVKQGYPVLNSHISGNKKTGVGHDAVVTKIKEKSRRYKSCPKVGLWWGRKCEWKTEYDYIWFRRQGWGKGMNTWCSPTVTGAFVAVID